jgi:membrane fusion protein, macrolide-specific efflux system
MRKTKFKIIFAVLIVLIIAAIAIVKMKSKGASQEITKEISPTMGTIQTFISTTGTVLPKNRLEVKPSVNGRIESILVQEGESVKVGQALAWMSSTERAALLDAAEGQGEEVLKYWKEVYKAIPLLSPIDGQVIVATMQPGQTVTTTDAVIVLSDHLIVRAQVDETDIGKIKLAQDAIITLDAYPDQKINATVEHIYYESQTVNSVTIYNVDLLPKEVPAFFRSGMNATVDFKSEGKENTLLLPVEALHKDKGQDYVLVRQTGNKEPEKRNIKLGITDDKNYEILSGVDKNDRIIIKAKKYTLPTGSVGTNPFMPARQPNRKSN